MARFGDTSPTLQHMVFNDSLSCLHLHWTIGPLRVGAGVHHLSGAQHNVP